MSELNEHFLNLEITEGIFNDIKYFITGEVHEKIESLLKSGGAEHQNYFSDYVTHLIVGKNPEENDVADANDVYEIPAVTPKWILMCASLKRRLDLNPFLFTTESKLFSGQVFCFSKITEDRNNLWGLISFNGGSVHLKLTSRCNFLVTGVTDGPKYEKAFSRGPEMIKIVTPDWVFEAVKLKGLPDPALFHPKLINWPKPVKPPEPTTAITGFEPDISESDEKAEEKNLPDSTQALLEKLKQRMPWNQPITTSTNTTTSSSDPVAPPNVVAPSFLSKMQAGREQAFKSPVPQMQTSQPLPVSSFSSTGGQSPNHIPRSIVHHIPNSQQSQQSTMQSSPLNINRLIGQAQSNRPTNLQQLRGQLNTSQIHQQLLQQRIQQQTQQNIIQRNSTGQINMNQQLLHQHLSQGQRQALQTQLINQQNMLNQPQGLLNQNSNLSQLNQSQQGQNPMVDTLNPEALLGQQGQSGTQYNQSNPLTSQSNQLTNQQNELAHQRNQVDRSPSHGLIMNSPQHGQNQLLSPQHQIQNPLLNHQQQNQQPPVNQLQQQNQLIHQQTNQLLNQQQVQNQLNQQERANQILNQQQQAQNQLNLQQERSSQLLNQQQNQNQLIQQQNQGNQQQLLGQQQTQNELQNQLLGQRSPQNQQIMQQNQQSQQHIQQNQHNQQIIQQNQNQIMQSQASQQLIPQNQQLMQQNPQMIQQSHPNQQLVQQSQQLNQQNQQLSQQNQLNQQGPIIRQNQLLNQQTQQILNQGGQHQQTLLSLPPNHHLSQLSPQQLQQLQQLKREQQQLLNQSQNQLGGLNQQAIGLNQQTIGLNQQNLGLNQQNNVSQGQNQQLVNQNPQIMGQNQQIQMNPQQLIQNRVMQSQNINQQLNQGQNFNQPGLNQHLLNQKQQIFGQQPINTSQHQQLLQNQQNLTSQPQFVNQNQFDAIQQQKLNQGGQNQLNQMNVQALNQQLQQQNLGQQLNQQLMQQNQQVGLNQQNLNQGLGLDQGMNQNLGLMNQQQANLNQQGGLNQQTISQQMNQISPGINQQVIRAQFPQQVLVNQGQQGGPQRAQLNQQIWTQQQQQAGGPIQGQQIIRHPVNVAVQQSPTSGAVGPRIQWPPGQQPGVPQRQFIQLDAHTHNQLQKMPPDQQHLFVAKLQKQRQLQLAKVQQRAGGHILIRGNVPQGLTPQQQIQWLQQQAKQQGIVLPPNIQQNLTPGNVTPQQGTPPAAVPPQHAPGLSPINQPNAAGQTQQFTGEQPTPQQLQLRQYRLQQLQLQREQAQKNVLVQQGGLPPQAIVRPPLGQPPTADSTTNPPVQVNPKTKTALANMLNIKLHSGGTIGAAVRPEGIPEPSAAGTLRMMTAQHHAAINSKPQEIIALHQRRVISGPNGEIIKPPGTPALPLTPQNEPPKLQYNPKAPIPVQHRVGPFYGHNPNLKLPPDLFLLGCIFVVVEVEDYLEERLPGWQHKIEKYGGEVEKQYCNKVTHVLCETQRHGVVMQALRDLKRCVTIRWLSDVIKRKQVLPPWTALHLPQIYLDITPASKHLISISGFEGNIRQVVKQMIMYTGAKCTNYFSKHNTLLICSKAEGKKFSHAKKWGIPVVNVQWLTDIILGNFTAMNQMDNQVYQTYSNPPNLSFDPKLVPNMMHAWKAPINISQESYERVKRSASPVSLPKAKKQKTEHTDENENITEEIPNSDYRILFSQFEPERLKELQKMVRELGGIVSTDYKDFTHLVIPKLIRSHKLLFAIMKSSHVLPDKWLEESVTAKSFLPESEFNLPTDEFNQTYGVSIEKTIHSPNKHLLLGGKSFWVTPSVFPSKKILSELIVLSGGKLERIRRSRAQIETASNNTPLNYFILTAKEDLHLVADLLKSKKDKQKVVCNVELVLSAVLKQEFEVEPYVVSVV